MNRLAATIRCDVRLQFRNGFYYATAFVLTVWVVALSYLPVRDLGWVLPVLVLGNLLINTFYFIGGLVLLEKGENTLEAQIVTPLRPREYLAAKLITLTGLALAENVMIIVLVYGMGFAVLPTVVGIILAATLYTLTGFAVIVRYDSINEYLLPSIGYTSLLLLPLVFYLGAWEHWLLYLHPLQGPLILLQGAFQPVAPWQMFSSICTSTMWIGLTYWWCRRTFQTFIIAGKRAGAQ